MSNGTKKSIKIIIPSSLDDEDTCMLASPLLREPMLMQDAYKPDQVMKLPCISKPCFHELTKQRNTTTWASNTGCSNEATKDHSNENMEAVAADVTILDTAESSPSEQHPCPRRRLLADVSTDVAKNIVKELYRPNAAVGDGGTADAIRKQIITGELVGKRDHIRKGRERVRQIERILSKNPSHPDKDLLKRLRNDLIDALGDA